MKLYFTVRVSYLISTIECLNMCFRLPSFIQTRFPIVFSSWIIKSIKLDCNDQLMVRIPRSGSLFVFRKGIAPKIPRNPRKKIEITLSLYKSFGYLHCFFFFFFFFCCFSASNCCFYHYYHPNLWKYSSTNNFFQSFVTRNTQHHFLYLNTTSGMFKIC